MYDVLVVGAGPAGGMAAGRTAAAGFRTLVVDRKRVLGEPVQCAEGVSRFGLVSNGIAPKEEWIAQTVAGARCVVPSGASFAVAEAPGYALDRAAFDRWLVDGAAGDGADIRTSTRVTEIVAHGGGWRVRAGTEAFDARIVIAADGPTSRLARSLGLLRRQEAIPAYEYRFRVRDVPDIDPDRFLLFVGTRYDGGYAWIFPRGDTANVGAGGHIDAHAAAIAFCRERGIDLSRRVRILAGTIPYRYEFTSYALPGFAVVGDAAGVANPMNGAGIHAALFSGRIAGECAMIALDREDPSHMAVYDRILRASPFLDPLLLWMIERVRTWDDRLMNAVGAELDGNGWRAADLRLALSAALRSPRLFLHAREFYRMVRALELCERFGW